MMKRMRRRSGRLDGSDVVEGGQRTWTSKSIPYSHFYLVLVTTSSSVLSTFYSSILNSLARELTMLSMSARCAPKQRSFPTRTSKPKAPPATTDITSLSSPRTFLYRSHDLPLPLKHSPPTTLPSQLPPHRHHAAHHHPHPPPLSRLHSPFHNTTEDDTVARLHVHRIPAENPPVSSEGRRPHSLRHNP